MTENSYLVIIIVILVFNIDNFSVIEVFVRFEHNIEYWLGYKIHNTHDTYYWSSYSQYCRTVDYLKSKKSFVIYFAYNNMYV